MSLIHLEPASIWKFFEALNAVPRASKKEERVIAFMVDFGKELGLPTAVDDVGNVLIRKAGTPGKEDRPVVVMQSHLDMVHQKNRETDFDFDTEGIRMKIDGDWVKADGTTLGADNGLGVATIMAILASGDIPHPPIEALFTIDEETGMTGALGLKGGWLTGRYLLNLDTEDDVELTIGCAGGIDVTATGTYTPESLNPGTGSGYEIAVTGLTGGHSGMDIHLGRGNANKIMNRILSRLDEQTDIRLGKLEGGSLRNAIPRESHALIAIDDENFDFEAFIAAVGSEIREEYSSTDPALKISTRPANAPDSVVPVDVLQRLTRSVYACPNGIYRMSPDIEGLVQTSNNLARVFIGEGRYEALCLTRSSVDSEKYDLARAIRAVFHLIGASVTTGGDYPGWTPKPQSDLVRIMSDTYEELFDHSAHVNACHAGLECGIIGQNYPEMDMISFGPNIRGAHSPDEKVQISSVQKFWQYLLVVLDRL